MHVCGTEGRGQGLDAFTLRRCMFTEGYDWLRSVSVEVIVS